MEMHFNYAGDLDSTSLDGTYFLIGFSKVGVYDFTLGIRKKNSNFPWEM